MFSKSNKFFDLKSICETSDQQFSLFLFTHLKLLIVSNRVCSISVRQGNNTIIYAINSNNLPLHCVSWGLPNHHMVYNVCFMLCRNSRLNNIWETLRFFDELKIFPDIIQTKTSSGLSNLLDSL